MINDRVLNPMFYDRAALSHMIDDRALLKPMINDRAAYNAVAMPIAARGRNV